MAYIPKAIHMIERNGAQYVIYGDAGIRQYWYYTKREAISLYMAEVRKQRS